MKEKSPASGNAKKPGRSVKEKREAKKEKQQVKSQERRSAENR